jgi:hypothetical protein
LRNATTCRLCELNVLRQAFHVCTSPVSAVGRGRLW